MTIAAIDQAWTLLIDLTLKSCLLGAAGGISLLLLRGAAPAARHFTLLLTLTTLLALPMLSFILPRWQVNWQPRFLPEITSAATESHSQASAGAQKWREVTAPTSSAALLSNSDSAAYSTDLIPRRPEEFTAGKPLSDSRFVGSAIAFRQSVLLLWCTGFLSVLLRLLSGLIVTSRLHQRSKSVSNEKLHQLTTRVQQEMGLSDAVILCQIGKNSDVHVPISYGWRHPAILLPRYMLDWPPERQRLVLLHEMAHIRRRDWPAQILAQLTCALYWFNPLVWWATRQLRDECERACDDRVLLAGAVPSAYADTLLEVIRTMQPKPSISASALSMARPPIEKRLRSILTPPPPQRRVLRRPLCVLLCLTFGVGILPLAAIHVNAKPAPPPVPPINRIQPAYPLSVVEQKTIAELRNQKLLDQKIALTSTRKSSQNRSREDAELRHRLEKMERLLVQNQRENQILRLQLQQLLMEAKTAKRQAERNQMQPSENSNARRAQIVALENMLDNLKQRHDVLTTEREQHEQRVKAGVETTEKVEAIETQMAYVAVDIQATQQRLQAVRAGRKVTPQEAERRTLQVSLTQRRITLDSLEAQLKLVKARVDTGQVSPTELTAVQAQIAAVKTEIAEIQARLVETKK